MPKKRILVVDDNPDSVDSLRIELEANNFEVLTTIYPAEAIHQATLTRPDLILMDVLMPMVDGFAICRRLKEINETAAIPVVLISGRRIQAFDQHKGKEAGAADYIIKPYNLDELIRRIRNVLGEKAGGGRAP